MSRKGEKTIVVKDTDFLQHPTEPKSKPVQLENPESIAEQQTNVVCALTEPKPNRQVVQSEPNLVPRPHPETSRLSTSSHGAREKQSLEEESAQLRQDLKTFNESFMSGLNPTCPICLRHLPKDHVDTTYLEGKEVHVACFRQVQDGKRTEGS